jgi:hypothetical protein
VILRNGPSRRYATHIINLTKIFSFHCAQSKRKPRLAERGVRNAYRLQGTGLSQCGTGGTSGGEGPVRHTNSRDCC